MGEVASIYHSYFDGLFDNLGNKIALFAHSIECSFDDIRIKVGL